MLARSKYGSRIVATIVVKAHAANAHTKRSCFASRRGIVHVRLAFILRSPLGGRRFAAPDFDQVDVRREHRDPVGEAPRPRPDAAPAAPEYHLRDVVRPGVLDDERRGIVAGEDRRARAELLRELHRSQHALALRRRESLQGGCLDVDGGPLDAELRREPRGAAHDVVPARARTDAAQQRRLGLPDVRDRLVRPVRLDVVLDPIGGAAQRELAQRHQVAFAEEVARRPLDLLGNVDLAGLEPREQVVGRDVDQHHFVGVVEERVGHRFPDRDAGDPADDVVEAFEMLDVERGEDIDAACQQLFDVLPSLRVARAFDVGVRELVDEDQRRATLDRRVEIELGELAALVLDRGGRQDLEALQQRFGFLAPVRLDDADHHVLAFAAQRSRRGEHRVGLADAGGGAEIDPQPPAPRRLLLCLDFREELVGIRTLDLHAGPSQLSRGV